MSYVITEHASVTRDLHPLDKSRYAQVRLTVTRSRTGRLTCSVVVRQVGGGVLRDRRLWGMDLPCEPGSAASVDPIAALSAALNAASEGL